MRLKQQVKLTVSLGGVEVFTSGDLRVDFLVEKLIGDALNTGKFVVYNLSDETVSGLSASGAGIANVKLEVASILEEGMTTLFEGDLVNIHSTPMYEDKLTTFWCWERGTREATTATRITKTFHRISIKSAIQQILSNVLVEGKPAFTADFSGVTGGKESRILNSYIVKDAPLQAIHKILHENGMVSSIREGALYVSDRPSKVGDEARLATANPNGVHKIHPLLLKKPIEFSMVQTQITYALTPSIRTLDIINIDYEGIPSSASGFSDRILQIVDGVKDLLPRNHYFITKVTHEGSLYTDTWETTIQGIVYLNTVEG